MCPLTAKMGDACSTCGSMNFYRPGMSNSWENWLESKNIKIGKRSRSMTGQKTVMDTRRRYYWWGRTSFIRCWPKFSSGASTFSMSGWKGEVYFILSWLDCKETMITKNERETYRESVHKVWVSERVKKRETPSSAPSVYLTTTMVCVSPALHVLSTQRRTRCHIKVLLIPTGGLRHFVCMKVSCQHEHTILCFCFLVQKCPFGNIEDILTQRFLCLSIHCKSFVVMSWNVTQHSLSSSPIQQCREGLNSFASSLH